MHSQRSVSDVQETIGPSARKRLAVYFRRAQLAYPPQVIRLIGLKSEKRLELWVQSRPATETPPDLQPLTNSGTEAPGRLNRSDEKSAPESRSDSARPDWIFLHSYPVLAASGIAGPKLREGDRQVPEGIYQIEYLNPNSRFHLSMKLNYPNPFESRMAQKEGRSEPGSDIFIHGRQSSIGCLAIGDPAIEELFVLVADTGKENVSVVIAPNDLRHADPLTEMSGQPDWLPAVYNSIRELMLATR